MVHESAENSHCSRVMDPEYCSFCQELQKIPLTAAAEFGHSYSKLAAGPAAGKLSNSYHSGNCSNKMNLGVDIITSYNYISISNNEDGP